ncbi:AAA family ATPase [Cobetia sp. 14N.309.X.WAT.E.A4]|uniref:ATP-dependent nuclease n=1 Tax=Cobetia sp. 14N.309.X.WAT.E.A4 TaxID=2998323 RepID=UPI0025B1C64B|nr:AAA family ATPase [Cobetia sp. 14N.309.X.WAT.E.A4]MDN2656850.1 AAA family ATPase [Cobetia sp. 14N.309.X.WAT.E.A4]
MSESNNDWRSAKEGLAELFSIFNINDDGEHHARRPQEITELELSLSRELSVWGTKIDIEIKEPDIDNVIKSNTQIWIDDGVRTDIVRKGHGLQRALTLALVQVLAKETPGRLHVDNDVRISNSKYFIFEEPELYLHPQAQRQLFDSFVKLSDLGSQVIICTHSSGLIDLERYRSIYIADKSDDEAGTVVRKCAGDIFEGDEKKDFNLTYWINPDRSELFFAKKVILLEGATEKAVIPALAKKYELYKYEYTAIDCGSKNSIPQYIKLLNCFLIPYVAVYDQDHQHHKNIDARNAADRSTQNILNVINYNIGHGLFLVNDIEEELGLPQGTSSKPYVALSHINREDFQISDSMLDKITAIYD